ncbi:MAG: arginyltransferase [Rhodospirillaceae bacterium]|nr:arginyltransferase [Rhodospirillaceae bacterium]
MNAPIKRPLQFFYGTAPQPCPYLPGRIETKVVTDLSGPDANAFHDVLSRAGFRRSHGIAYRPTCPGCSACVPVRIIVDEFADSRSLRRVRRANADLTVREAAAVATLEQYALFKRYEQARHGDGEMAQMTFADYRAMVEETPVATRLIEFRDEANALVAVCLTDRLSDGLSGVYKFFDPRRSKGSLGTHVILWHIDRAAELGLPFVYLGYWIAGCRKMTYKARFQPMEALGPEGWQRFEPAEIDDGD